MPEDDQFNDQDFAPHQLPWSDFDDIARAYAEPAVVRRLRRAERSRRLLLLRALLDELTKAPDLLGPLPSPDDAWELLARVQDAAPRVLDLMLAHPYTGSWVGYATRLLCNQITGVCPLWMHVGHVHALAAAAAIRARINFETRIPVWNGHAMLPTLGVARVSAEAQYSVASVHSDGDGVEIVYGTTRVRLPYDDTGDRDHWWGLRTLAIRADGLHLSIRLDDLDPYRGLYEPILPQRLDAVEVDAWQVMLDEAWQLIVGRLPDLASGFPAGLDSLVPRPTLPFGNLSASTGEAFGSAIIARPSDAAELAATLVHEFHHILLGGLLHLIPMHENDTRERFYTLWRQDPRPIGGVLHGVYAFFGVTAFWRALARSETGREQRRAQFEFAYWRAGCWRTLLALSRDASLTQAGRRFVGGVAERLGPWQDEPVPADVADLAASAVADHSAGWRIRHLRPRPDIVADFAESWLAGRSWPTVEPDEPTMPTPVPDGSWSAARTELIRFNLANPVPSRWREFWPMVPGATFADFAYVTGQSKDAIRHYLADLSKDSDSPDSWVGLGLALSAQGGGSAGARALLRCPELVRAVHRRVRSRTGTSPAPDKLAEWIGRYVC